MPVTPQNTTDTLFVDYAFQDQQRSFQLHQRLGGDGAQLDNVAQSFLNQLAPLMDPTWVITGVRVRFAGTNVSLPIPPFVINAAGGTLTSGINKPRFVSFVGRSNTGKRSRLSIYGINLTLEDDYRMEAGDNAALDAARAVLNVSSNVIGAVDGSLLTWYPYYNWGFNAYHQREARES